MSSSSEWHFRNVQFTITKPLMPDAVRYWSKQTPRTFKRELGYLWGKQVLPLHSFFNILVHCYSLILEDSFVQLLMLTYKHIQIDIPTYRHMQTYVNTNMCVCIHTYSCIYNYTCSMYSCMHVLLTCTVFMWY